MAAAFVRADVAPLLAGLSEQVGPLSPDAAKDRPARIIAQA